MFREIPETWKFRGCPDCSQRLEHSEAVKRLEQLERAAVVGERWNDWNVWNGAPGSLEL
jgi:hypothetical protein